MAHPIRDIYHPEKDLTELSYDTIMKIYDSTFVNIIGNEGATAISYILSTNEAIRNIIRDATSKDFPWGTVPLIGLVDSIPYFQVLGGESLCKGIFTILYLWLHEGRKRGSLVIDKYMHALVMDIILICDKIRTDNFKSKRFFNELYREYKLEIDPDFEGYN